MDNCTDFLKALGGSGALAHTLVGAQAVELLVKAQQVHMSHPTGSHHTVLHSQLVQVCRLIGQGQLLLLHLPVGDQLLDEHHQLDGGERRGCTDG